VKRIEEREKKKKDRAAAFFRFLEAANPRKGKRAVFGGGKGAGFLLSSSGQRKKRGPWARRKSLLSLITEGSLHHFHRG